MDVTNLRGRSLKLGVKEILCRLEWKQEINSLIEIKGAKLTNALFSATYSDNDLIKWRSVSAFGMLAQWFKINDSSKIREIMRRCIWMLTEESGGIPWNAPAIMGEIMANSQEIASDYASILFSYIDEIEDGAENFLEHTPLRKSVFWGIHRLAESWPNEAITRKNIIWKRIDKENDPEISALLCLLSAKTDLAEAKNFIVNLLDDNRIISMYLNDEIENNPVSYYAEKSLAMIN